jgi:cysteine desulfurase
MNEPVYLDNAATTFLDEEVLEAMLPYMQTLCGSASSVHSYGRQAKVALEKARKEVARLLKVTPSEIFFTSGGTEGNNMVLRGAVERLNIKHVITSAIEHLAVLQPLEHMVHLGQIQLHYVELDEQGHIQYTHLEKLLNSYAPALVSLMHGNNEIGNLNELVHIGNLCKQYRAIFHTDAVQTLGHYSLDLQQVPVDLLVGSAHKFHGPKGIGVVYIHRDLEIAPLLYGGGQERGMRGGTENVPGVVGLSTALSKAYRDMEANKQHILGLKRYMIDSLRREMPDVSFYGASADLSKSLYTILSVSLPPSDHQDMVLFNLDINQVAASAGSACTSGSQTISHVIKALQLDPQRSPVRFSFSKYNTLAEVSYAVEKLAEIYRL